MLSLYDTGAVFHTDCTVLVWVHQKSIVVIFLEMMLLCVLQTCLPYRYFLYLLYCTQLICLQLF